jgi:hypothetical protein
MWFTFYAARPALYPSSPSIGTNRAAIILTLTKNWSLGNIEI